ncbi:MAG: hypothetical protein NTU44_13545 [Bacteroidetes bacterium]|nr:hypothetical protein [Bacteroidota bacterium]
MEKYLSIVLLFLYMFFLSCNQESNSKSASHNDSNIYGANQGTAKLKYSLRPDYIIQSDETFSNRIDDINTNSKNKNTSKKILKNYDGTLWVQKSNPDEQVIVYELPIPSIKNESDCEKFSEQIYLQVSNNFKTFQEVASFSIFDRGASMFKGKYKYKYIKGLISFKDGDKRYWYFNVVNINNNYYQVLINTFIKNNGLDSAFISLSSSTK